MVDDAVGCVVVDALSPPGVQALTAVISATRKRSVGRGDIVPRVEGLAREVVCESVRLALVVTRTRASVAGSRVQPGTSSAVGWSVYSE